MKIFKNSLVFVLFFVSTILSAISTSTVTSTAVTSVDEDSAYSYTLAGRGTPGDDLNWSAKSGTTLPSWLSLDTNLSLNQLATLNRAGYLTMDNNNILYVTKEEFIGISPNEILQTTIMSIDRDGNQNIVSTLPNRIKGMVYSDSKLYVADYYDNNILYLELNNIGGGWHSLISVPSPSALSFYDNNIYVASQTDKNIYKINVTTPVLNPIITSVPALVDAITLNDNGRIFLSQRTTPNATINQYNAQGNFQSAYGSFSSTIFSLASFENSLFVGLNGGGVQKFLLDTNTTQSITASSSIKLIEDNQTLYVSDWTTGVVSKMTLNPSLKGTPANAEVGIHDVNLTLSDATSTVEHNFQITVNNLNDAPTDIALTASTIAENSATGTTIATLSTTDIDIGDTFSYSFCGGADDNNFTITDNTLQSNAVFDYESKASYSICVRTTDSGSAAFDKSFTITISDVDESQNDGTSNEGTTTNDGTTTDGTSNDGTTNNGTSNNETTIEATQAQQCVEEAIRSITFDDIKGANVIQEYITSGLNLIASKSIDCGSMEFIWSSSDSSVIDNSGVVTTGAEDKSISLTAKVIYQESQSQKSFLLTVRKTTLSDAEILKSLSFEKIKKENKNSSEILGTLDLITSFMTKTITWSSLPARGSEDTAVTLTASLGSETKEFNLIVKKVLTNDEEKAASDKAWLSYENLLGKNKDNTNIKYDLSSPLPSTAPDGSTISWSSSNLASLSNSGVVTRSANGDKHSVLTATFTRGSVEVKKEFILRILQNKPQEDTGTTFTRIEQGEKTISVLVDDKGNEKNTSVAFGADIKFETSMVEESIKQTVEFADKKLSVYLNADGTSQAQTESLDEKNNAVISSVQSKIPGTQTSIDNSGKTTLSVSGSSSHINASINTDGSIEHIVVRADNQKQSRATSKIKGSSTVVSSDGSVQTASQTILDGYIVKAVVTTDSEGQSRTKFVKENINTGMQTNVENTLDESTPYEAGNVVEISEINGLLYIKTNAPLNGNLIIE